MSVAKENHSQKNSLPVNKGVSVVSEAVCQEVMGRADAFTAVESVFSAMAKNTAYNFPVIREAIGHADALYGFKSGFDRDGMAVSYTHLTLPTTPYV